jgi:hypothetical protein
MNPGNTKQNKMSNSIHLKTLAVLALKSNQERYPSMPDHCRPSFKYTDATANGLTKAIIHFLQFNGCQAERISTTGQYREGETFKDVIGFTRVTPGQWTKGTGTPGSADISAVIRGRSVKIEVKIGKDRQSEAQERYQDAVEHAGGVYFIAKSFDSFFTFYTSNFQL